jgi:hypothetical protein
MRCLGYGWAAPASAVGLVWATMACAAGARAVIVGGTVEVTGGRLGRAMARLPRGWRMRAITLGHVIIASDRRTLDMDGCRAHERVHVRQYERWGALFFPLYLGSSLWQLLRRRRPYWDNYFERQARRE